MGRQEQAALRDQEVREKEELRLVIEQQNQKILETEKVADKAKRAAEELEIKFATEKHELEKLYLLEQKQRVQQEETRASLQIQSVQRGKAARKEAQQMKEQRKKEEERRQQEEEEQRATLHIQSVQRGNAARNQAKQMMEQKRAEEEQMRQEQAALRDQEVREKEELRLVIEQQNQ